MTTGDETRSRTVNPDGSVVEGKKITALDGGLINVNTGSGMDIIKVVMNANVAHGVLIDAGGSEDTITADVREYAGDMLIDTGMGSDTVEVIKGNHHTWENKYYDEVINVNEQTRGATNHKLTLSSMDRGDRVTVDTSAALAIAQLEIVGSATQAQRGSPFVRDRSGAWLANSGYKPNEMSAEDTGTSVFLKGELAKPSADQMDTFNPITYVDANDPSKGFKLHTHLSSEGNLLTNGNRDYTLTVTGSAKNNYTDSLLNKKTVEIGKNDLKPVQG